MNKPNTSQGTPLDKTLIYKSLLNFIDGVLFDFKPFSKDDKGNIVVSEDLITQDFEKVLNTELLQSNIKYFAFQNQHKEGRYTTDISVYRTHSYEDFCWIEAKRLPTPNAGKARDEREYVIVSTEKDNNKKKLQGNGGIQRFKEGKHARKHSFAIMIGYIQAYDSTYWLSKINEWISELINQESSFWNENDYLRKQGVIKCDRYMSVHDRRDDLGQIVLQHFWIRV